MASSLRIIVTGLIAQYPLVRPRSRAPRSRYLPYRRGYFDNAWCAPRRAVAEDLLAHADAVLNVSGVTYLAKEGLKIGRPVYFGTDPVRHELEYAKGDGDTRTFIEEHSDCVTYGENIGQLDCLIPPLPRLRSRTRQPILLDCWQGRVIIGGVDVRELQLKSLRRQVAIVLQPPLIFPLTTGCRVSS